MAPSNEIWSGVFSYPLDYQFVLWIDDLSTINSLVHVGVGVGTGLKSGGGLEHLSSSEYYLNIYSNIVLLTP